MPDLGSVREILRALADVRNDTFLIFQVANSDEVVPGVGVSAIRPDGTDIFWSLGLETSAVTLIVTASVTIYDNHNNHEVFSRTANAMDSSQASALIRTFASEVCAERHWLEATIDDQSRS